MRRLASVTRNHAKEKAAIGQQAALVQDGSSVTGLPSEQVIAEMRIQKAFVSRSGFSVDKRLDRSPVYGLRNRNQSKLSLENKNFHQKRKHWP